MAEKKDNQMSRSTTQALYKYVPEKWIDFYLSQSRKGVTAYVTRWSSIPLESVNKKRLLRQVRNAVDNYKKMNESLYVNSANISVKNFGTIIDENTYSVLTPRANDYDRGIVSRISPKAFFCEKCKTVYRFKKDEQYSGIIRRKCTCGGNLVQLRYIYYCKCGWAGEVTIGNCPEHKTAPVKINIRDFEYSCSVCNKRASIFRKCPECGEKLFPQTVLDSAQSFVKSMSIIDLLDEKLEDFISGEDDGSKIVTANYLGLISDTEFRKTVKYGRQNQQDIQSDEYERLLAALIDQGLPEETAKTIALKAANHGNDDPIKQAITTLNSLLLINSEILGKLAEEILEYKTVKDGEEVVTLEDAINMSKELNTHPEPEKYYSIVKDSGFKYVQASDRIPFIQCSYGYTRKYVDSSYDSSMKSPVVLKGFPDESPEKKNIYATKLLTEGVLFELDQLKILKWLLKNKVIEEKDLPTDLDNAAEVKAWFMNNFNSEEIQPFSVIDETMYPITAYSYRLIHTISHLLIKSAAELCGLDQNSLSEYVFPNISAVFIYCQNSQGFNMGALFSVFEMYFDRWIEKAREMAKECIFDPVCIEHDASCTGCVYTNEISCQHFNHDLDRALIIGKLEREKNKRIYGYWEDITWQ